MDSPYSLKSYALTFELRPGYLYAYVSGEKDNYDVCVRYWQEISDKLTETGEKKVMIDEDIVEESPMADVFRLASELADMGFRGKKIAFVDRHSAHKDLNDFGVLVGTNRGLIGKAFNDQPEAEKWLLSNET